ncbi:hypothetical protein SUGI_0357170 [Cryptomeria japonica]|nr:hypothetical protein SUGI_0357170 [Cryptomeria japonica]
MGIMVNTSVGTFSLFVGSSISAPMGPWKDLFCTNLLPPMCGVTIENFEIDTYVNIEDVSLNWPLEKMVNALVGKFVGRNLDIVVVHKWAPTKWVIKGSLSILSLPKGPFFFSFTPFKDCENSLLDPLAHLGNNNSN